MGSQDTYVQKEINKANEKFSVKQLTCGKVSQFLHVHTSHISFPSLSSSGLPLSIKALLCSLLPLPPTHSILSLQSQRGCYDIRGHREGWVEPKGITYRMLQGLQILYNLSVTAPVSLLAIKPVLAGVHWKAPHLNPR